MGEAGFHLTRLVYRLATRGRRTAAYGRALASGDHRLARALIRQGIDLKQALEPTLGTGTTELLRELIFNGLRLEPSAGAPLLQAFRSPIENSAKFGALIAGGVRADATVGPDQWTLLGFAAFFGELELAGLLLEHGADPRKSDRSGLTPLLMARIGGRRELARLLLEHGAQDERPGLRQIEPAFISGNGFHSQVHEAVKTALRFGGRELERLEIRVDDGRGTVFRYFPLHPVCEIEIRFLGSGELQASCLDSMTGKLLRDLLAENCAAGIGLRELSTRLQIALEEISEGARGPDATTGPGSATAYSGPVLSACKVLGVSPGADARQILAAYRSLARATHPDAALPGASEEELSARNRRMAEVNLAYRTIRNAPSSEKD